jgi:hypothetical protein
LSAETKWEIFLQVTTGEVTQADAARKWQVDVSTVIGIRRTVKDALPLIEDQPPAPTGLHRHSLWRSDAHLLLAAPEPVIGGRNRSASGPRRSV